MNSLFNKWCLCKHLTNFHKDIISHIIKIYKYISYIHEHQDSVICRKCNGTLIYNTEEVSLNIIEKKYKCINCKIYYIPCYECYFTDNIICFCRIFGYSHKYERNKNPEKAIKVCSSTYIKEFQDINPKSVKCSPEYYIGHLNKYCIPINYLEDYFLEFKCEQCKYLQDTMHCI